MHELGRSDCEANGDRWTSSGCRTEDELKKLEDDEASDLALLKEREKFKSQGWTRLGSMKVGVDGIYRKEFTEKQYRTVEDDPRCANNPNCVAFMVRTDSVTSCPERLHMEANILNGKIIMGSIEGTVRRLPASSTARVVLPIRVDIGDYEFGDATLTFTKIDCT